MLRYIIVFFIFLNFLNASAIKKIELLELENINTKIEDIKNSKDFKKTTLPLIRESKNVFFLKLTLDKNEFINKKKVIEFSAKFDIININKEFDLMDINHHKIITIDEKNFVEHLYIKAFDNDGKINVDIKVHDREEYLYKQITIGKFFGVSYGIIFAAFLYYFALYLFNRDKSYIYYSLTQLSVLCMLVFLIGNSEFPELLKNLIIFSFFVFSNLFTRSFLNTKKLSPKSHFLINLALILFIIDMLGEILIGQYILDGLLPKAFLLVFYIIAALDIYLKGYKPALFYLFAWGIVTLGFIFVDLHFYLLQNDLLYIDPLYIVHVILPLESLILAFALSYKMKLLEKKRAEQQQFLTYQSKLASMGEMISNIAHQWRQPLTHLSYIMMNLKTAFEKDKLTKEYFDKKSKLANAQLEYMSHTIDDFRDFFKNTKQKEDFNLKEALDEVINLLDASFDSYKIQIAKSYEENINILGYKGELLQVIFNILNNAKDEFLKKEIENPKLEIISYMDKKHIIIEINDNALGIPKELINKIFEPYFTTKDKGLGIGLYMSKMIIEKKFEGKLEVLNIEKGASFKIKLKR